MARKKGKTLSVAALLAKPMAGRDLRVSTMSNGRPIALFRGPLSEISFQPERSLLVFVMLWGATMRLINPDEGVWHSTPHLPPGLVLDHEPRELPGGRIILGMSGSDLYEVLAPGDNLDWVEVIQPMLDVSNE